MVYDTKRVLHHGDQMGQRSVVQTVNIQLSKATIIFKPWKPD